MNPLLVGNNGVTGEPVWIDAATRARHMYILGQTGTGKTNALESLIIQDIQNGEGLCYIDPHGDSAESLISKIPFSRKNDLIYIDLDNTTRSVGLNFMTDTDPEKRSLAAENVVSAFKHVYKESWGPRMEYIFVNAVTLLMDNDITLLGMPRLLTDKRFRLRLLRSVTDPLVRYFWEWEFPEYEKKFSTEAVAPLQNKIGRVLGIPSVRAILSQQTNTVDLRDVMDRRNLLIVSLQKGQIGEEPAKLFGALVVSSIAQAAFSRSTTSQRDRVPFTLYADEFQNVSTGGFPLILSEARKYALRLVVAHQGTKQVPEEIMDAVLSNCGTFLSFRIGHHDASIMAKTFRVDSPGAFQDLENYRAKFRTLLRGNPTDAINITTLPPAAPLHDRTKELISHSQKRYGVERAVIERNIKAFLPSRPFSS